MKNLNLIVFTLIFLSIILVIPNSNAVTGVTVSTVATDNTDTFRIWIGTSHAFGANHTLTDDTPYQWRILKDKNDRYWVFYPRKIASGAVEWSYRYSNDTITWSSASSIGTGFSESYDTRGLVMNYSMLNIWYSNEGTDGLIYITTNYFEAVNISYNYCFQAVAQGTISGMTIAWQIKAPTISGFYCYNVLGNQYPSWGGGVTKDISKNSTSIFEQLDVAGHAVEFVHASNDGWVTIKSTFQMDTNTLSNNYGGANILAVKNSTFVTVIQNITRIYTRVSGSNNIDFAQWGALQNLGNIGNIKTGFAAISENTHNFIYLTLINNSNIYFYNGTVNYSTRTISFASPVLLESSVSNTAPAIYYMNSTGNTYVFFSKTGRIYVSQFNASSNTWLNKIMVIDGSDYGALISGKSFNTGINLGNNKVAVIFRTTENSNRTLRIATFDNLLTNVTAPVFQGKLCGNVIETNHNITTLSKLNSIMCISDFQTGAIINRTGFRIANYTNQFMSAWATLSIYMGNDGAIISNEHPLKLVWQKTYEVRNNTNNQVVEYYPNLFVPDHNYVAVAFSSTEDISMNTTDNTNTQYIVNQYAPTTVSFLQSSDNKVMLYAYWYRQNITFAGDNSFAVETTSFIPIPSNIQAFWISVGMPPQAGGFIILITGIIMLAIVVLTKGVDEPEKVIGILGITAILCASAVNLIPVEIGIAVMIFVAAYFAMKIYSRMAGGSGE